MTWRNEYRAAMLSYVLRNGTVVPSDWSSTTNPVFERRDGGKIREHLLCDGAKLEKLEESSWWTGYDTFNSGHEVTGVDLIVSCACGEVESQRVRYEGTVGEILMGLLGKD